MPSSRIPLVDEKENSQMEQIQKHIRNVSNKFYITLMDIMGNGCFKEKAKRHGIYECTCYVFNYKLTKII